MTIEFGGTSKFTKAPAAISELSPTVMLPHTVEFAYRVTLLPTLGKPAFLPWRISPIVQPLNRVTLLPNTALALTVIHQGCINFTPPHSQV